MEDRFQIVSDYRPQGDQPKAIAALVQGVERGDRPHLNATASVVNGSVLVA